jgi:insertion element IS1 protein InsB
MQRPEMQCPDCGGTHIRKNGHRQAKQNYICVSCKRQFLDQYDPRGYSDEVKRL